MLAKIKLNILLFLTAYIIFFTIQKIYILKEVK